MAVQMLGSKKIKFDGKVRDMSDEKVVNRSTLTIEFSFHDDKDLEEKLARYSVLEGKVVSKGRWCGKVMNDSGFSEFKVGHKVFEDQVIRDGAIGHFDGVKLHSITKNGGNEVLTFIKWILGSLNYERFEVGSTMTVVNWESIYDSFRRSQEHKQARLDRQKK